MIRAGHVVIILLVDSPAPSELLRAPAWLGYLLLYLSYLLNLGFPLLDELVYFFRILNGQIRCFGAVFSQIVEFPRVFFTFHQLPVSVSKGLITLV